jgi:diguanylate cyclase (GGDEF)-like protein/PAS domain S-box-containing protein
MPLTRSLEAQQMPPRYIGTSLADAQEVTLRKRGGGASGQDGAYHPPTVPGNPMTARLPKTLDHPQPLLAKALANSATAAFIANRQGNIVWVNQAFVELSGYAGSELLGRPAALRRDGQWRNGHHGCAPRPVDGCGWQREVVDNRRDGSPYTVDEVVTPLLDEAGVATHFFVQRHDISARARRDQQNEHRADHDELTGLAKRCLFHRELDGAIAQARRESLCVSTLFVDLDHFKPVNDTLGHHVGDQLLSAVAQRLRANVRQGDLVARWGGDEFSILLAKLPEPALALTLAGKLRAALELPFSLRGVVVNISASIGVAVYPRDGLRPRTLLRKADGAMYRAKHAGGNGVETCRRRRH